MDHHCLEIVADEDPIEPVWPTISKDGNIDVGALWDEVVYTITVANTGEYASDFSGYVIDTLPLYITGDFLPDFDTYLGDNKYRWDIFVPA